MMSFNYIVFDMFRTTKCSSLGRLYKQLYGTLSCNYTGCPGGKVNILGGHSIGHSKQKTLYEHVSYFERFPR
jgi:hypothetical protein